MQGWHSRSQSGLPREEGCSSRDGHRRAAAELAAGALHHKVGQGRLVQQLASLPGASPGPASTLGKAHLLPTQAWLFSPMKLGDCLLLRKKVATRARLLGSLFPRTKGAFQSICMSQATCSSEGVVQGRRAQPLTPACTAHTRPEPFAELHAECKGPLAQDAFSGMPVQCH